MNRVPPSARSNCDSGANLGFEQKLWVAADKLRGNTDAAEYKHVLLGLIFLKYISDAFEEHQGFLATESVDPDSRWFARDDTARSSLLGSREVYASNGVFWVPDRARWSHVVEQAAKQSIGAEIDAAMVALESANESLAHVLPRGYARESLDKRRLGELVMLVDSINLGGQESRSKDVLGRVYEFFLGRFAGAEGKNGGQFYTPRCVVQLLVEMLQPYRGSVLVPCCGSGGMFVQSEKFVAAHGGTACDLSIYGQESNQTTWRLCVMNLAIRHIKGNVAWNNEGSFHCDAHTGLQADFVIANPPFNDSDWGSEHLRGDKRWKYGTPPASNANFAWVQHFIHHLAPGGMAGFVLANGSLSSCQSGEGDIRKAIADADLVDCIVTLPDRLFYSTQIPVCLWFVAKSKNGAGFRDRRGQTLFIDARNLGTMIDRTHRELAPSDITRMADVYHAWRAKDTGAYRDVPGFCCSATLDAIRMHRYALVPGRYVGFAQRPIDNWDRGALGREIAEVQARVESVGRSSSLALDLLRKLLDG